MIDEKKRNMLKNVGLLFGLLVLVDFIGDIVGNIRNKDWNALYTDSTTLIVIAIVAFILRDKFRQGWDSLSKTREVTREQFEKKKGNIGLKDAAIFSLAWSREIYKGIPKDRKTLVKTSFTLIGIAMGLVMINSRSGSLLIVLLIAGLILAGVNLLIWVVGSEREEKDRIAIELDAARKMQMSLMPEKDPEVKGFDISGCCIPAKNVGGDLFDFVWSGKNHDKLCIPIVDVSGKGMDAALTAVYTSGAIASEAQHEKDIVSVMDHLNSTIYSRQNRSRFVSMLMTTLEVPALRMEYVNAGQSKPILLRDNQVEILTGEGARFPLGVMESPRYQQNALQLKPKDTLLLYTDGVTEAMNAQQEMYGEERLIKLFTGLVQQGLNAKEIVLQIKTDALEFSGPNHQHDDLTIVAVRAI
ncbi:MAG: PP2C family protein-serine/threonine phosphatase [bacterium]|nr:PP2C family protein-serine/threonine phosphatase [bacterium]